MPMLPAANCWLMSLQPKSKLEPIELSVHRIFFSMLSAWTVSGFASVALALVPLPVSMRPPSE